MIDRRTFLLQSSILSSAFFVSPCNELQPKFKTGLQLYTLRDIIGKNTKEVIKQIADAGYNEVEMFGLSADNKFFGFPVKDFASLLKDNQLSSPGGHYTPAEFLFKNGNGDDVKNLLDVANLLGNKYLIIPYLAEENRKNLDQYKALADRLNKAGEMAKSAGLVLAYHNHDFEFKDLGGRNGYDILLTETDKVLVKMEMDIYWVVRAGYDPVTLFRQQPGRFHLWHVKDMDAQDKEKNTEVGNGTIDFSAIFAQASLAGVKHFIVEQENNYVPDYIGSISNSNKVLRQLLKKKG